MTTPFAYLSFRRCIGLMSIRFCVACLLHFTSVGAPIAAASDWMEKTPVHRQRIMPEAGAKLVHTPPVFFWPAMAAGARYTLRLMDAHGQRTEKTTQDNFLVWPSALSEGNYTWQVDAYSGGRQYIGAPRSFSVASNPRYLGDMDTSTILAEIANRQRPRFFPEGAAWATTSKLLAGERRAMIALITKRASSIAHGNEVIRLSAQNSVVPKDRLTFKRVATKMATAMEDYAFLWRLTQNPVWKEKISEILSVIASIDQGDLYSDPSDLLTARFFLWASVIAYDWGGDALDAHQKKKLLQDIEHGTAWLTEQVTGEARGLAFNPYNSQASEVIGTALIGSSCLLGEKNVANAWFRTLFPLYLASLFPTVTTDGADKSAGAYAIWGYTTSNLPIWETLRWASRIDLSGLSQAQRMGRWISEVAPPGNAAVWWGDGAELLRRSEWESAIHLLADRSSDAKTHQYARQLGAPRYPSVWNALAPIRPQPAVSAACSRPTVFNYAGIAVMTDESDPSSDLRAHFKSSPFGAAVHAHYDQNSFVITYKGKHLAIDSGSYDYWESPHYLDWYKRTVAHNAITFDGGKGQELDAAPKGDGTRRGRIINHGASPEGSFVVGDASNAYGRHVTSAFRTLAVLPGGLVIVYDQIGSTSDKAWEWNLHTSSAKKLDESSLQIANGDVRACVDLFSEHAATLQIQRKHSPPVNREWGMSAADHVIYAITSPASTNQFLAAFRLDCAPVTLIVKFDADGAKIALQNKILALSREGVTWK